MEIFKGNCSKGRDENNMYSRKNVWIIGKEKCYALCRDNEVEWVRNPIENSVGGI